MWFFSLIFSLLLSLPGLAQEESPFEDDFQVGGDIFSDYADDLEEKQIYEDERFYRYGRFLSANIGFGLTYFTGTREDAYSHDPPTYSFSFTYFTNFRSAFVIGLEYSQHNFVIDTFVRDYADDILGLVSVSMLRPFLGYRYYINTTNLGTAITYANPYLTARVEYWYQTNKFVDRENELESQKGGGLGASLGFGLEFPIVRKKSYIGFEFLYHFVNFFDKDTIAYQQIPDDPNSAYGYDDLNGHALSIKMSFNFSW